MKHRGIVLLLLNASAIPALASPEAGHLIVCDGTMSRLVSVDPVTGEQTLIADGGLLTWPTGVIIEDHNHALVTDRDAENPQTGSIGAVIRVNLTSGEQELVSSGGPLAHPTGIARSPDGTFSISDLVDDSVLSLDSISGNLSRLTTGNLLGEPTGLAYEADGGVVVIDRDRNSVIRFNPVTGTQSTITSGLYLDEPTGIAVEPSGQILVTEPTAFRILRINPATGIQSTLLGGIIAPLALTIDQDGTIFLNTRTSLSGIGVVSRVNPITGTRTTITTGGLLVIPTGIAIMPAQPCPADLAEPTGTLDFFDVSAFLASFASGQSAADLTATFGAWDFFDVSAFLQLFTGGCP